MTKDIARAVLSMIVVTSLLAKAVPLQLNPEPTLDEDWIIETLDSIGSVGLSTSIALDEYDHPHISYLDWTNYDLKYTKWDGDKWVNETVDSKGDVGWPSSLAIDKQGRPHIAYFDAIPNDLKYATWDGSIWKNETVDSAGFVGIYPSLALDGLGHPHISYHDYDKGDLKYARWDGSQWIIETVDWEGTVGRGTSIEIDSSGYPHIGYYDITNMDLKYAMWNGSAWVNVTVDSKYDVGAWPSMALDSNGRPHFSYVLMDYYDLRYAMWNGSAWIREPVDTAGKLGKHSSIAIDSNDIPHISYNDMMNDDLKYANRIAGSWVLESVDVVDLVGTYSSLAIDSNDNPHISYLNYTSYDLKYATKEELSGGLPPVADAGGPYLGSEGSQITLDASGSYDPDGDDLEFRWDFENDGTWDSGWSSVDSISHTWYDDFEGQVTVEVRERREVNLDVINDGEYKRYSFVDEDFEQAQSFKPTQLILSRVAVDVSVLPSVEPIGNIILHIRKTLYGQDIVNSSLSPDVMPVGTRNPLSLWPRFDVSDINVTPGEQYFIVLTCPTCSKGYYHIEFSDDTYPNGTSFVKPPWSNSFSEYPDIDLRFATFWANLSSPRLSDKDTANVTIENVSPTPEWASQSGDGTILTPPYPEGKEIAFEATVSDPGIYDTFTFDWAFGDGMVLVDAGPSVIHTYGDDKTYTVVLTVTDDDGGVGVDDTPPLPTTNEDPVPEIDLPFCIFVEGLDPCEAIGMFSDPGWLDTHTAVWDFGDGTSEAGVITEKHDPPASTGWNISSHLYGDNGLYTITFTVTDDDGGEGVATAEVPVQNHPPSFDLWVPITVSEGERFVLGVEATDPGSDDVTISVDWGDGTSDSQVYYNDGVGPDPPNSGAGVFPFVVQTDFTHVYSDDGDYDVTVEVEDDDGGIDVKAFQIPVQNVAPTVTLEVLPIEVNASLRIAGEKWHDVSIELYEDGIPIFNGTIVRYPGSPNDQMLDMSHLQIDVSKRYTVTVRYTPEDDPVNGQPNGATPCWIILRFDDGQELWLHRTFNVQHPEGYVWEVDLTAAILVGHGLTFEATAYDQGADDLTFYWDFGDSTNVTANFYPNVNKTFPVTVTDIMTHMFSDGGKYTVTVTVEDDNGGQGIGKIVVVIP